jgi:hypothetical protein
MEPVSDRGIFVEFASKIEDKKAIFYNKRIALKA